MSRAGSRLWVWAEAVQLLHGFEQRQRRFFTVTDALSVPCWAPLVDAYERNEELQLVIALPGVNAEQFEVILDKNELLIRGHRPIPDGLHRAAIHRLEIPYGRFERRITLPAGDYCVTSQAIENGCLKLGLRHNQGAWP